MQLLIDEAKRMYPDSIKFHFGHPCEGWDLDARQVHVASLQGKASQAGACHFLVPVLSWHATEMLCTGVTVCLTSLCTCNSCVRLWPACTSAKELSTQWSFPNILSNKR